jgi:hypothetical protein
MTAMQTQKEPTRGRGLPHTCAYRFPPSGLITVTPWRQASIFRPCPLADCRYLEEFWLGILGPTATWLARHLSRLVVTQSDADRSQLGVTVDISELGARLGVSSRPLHDSVLVRGINRLVMFNFVTPTGVDKSALAVRASTPRVSDRLVARMHPSHRHTHRLWMAQSATDELGCCVPQRH